MLALHLSGCFQYTVVTTDPRLHIESGPERVRVTAKTGEQLTLTRPYIARDSVIQKEPICRFDRVSNRRICPNKGLPFSAVAILESGSRDTTAEVMLAIGGLGALTAFLVLTPGPILKQR